VESALKEMLSHPSEIVQEHCYWALQQLAERAGNAPQPLPIMEPSAQKRLKRFS